MATPASAADATNFNYRGVIEGFYGPPWPESSRTDLMRWIGAHGMNIYVHAPKNDPYQRLRWRQPYPAAKMASFAREVDVARAGGVQWIPSVSPALPLLEVADERDSDICYACPGDLEVLYGKLDAFWAIGVRQFMLSFDDTIKASTHTEDAAAFGVGDAAYGRMNAELLNTVYKRYAPRDSSFKLFTVPVDYSGTSSTAYLDAFREALRPEVVVMWTGTSTVPKQILCDEANKYAAAIGRKPLVWDNYPVNDYAPNKLMVGAYKGRGPELAGCLEGILANPSALAQTNRIPLFTVADYLNNPQSYDPERSWDRSLAEFAGPFRPLLQNFVDNVRSTALDRTEAIHFTALADALMKSFDADDPRWTEAHGAFLSKVREYRDAGQQLQTSFPDAAFVQETAPWLNRLTFTSNVILEAADLLARLRPRVSARFDGNVLTGRVLRPASMQERRAMAETADGLRGRDDGNPPNVYGDREFFAFDTTYSDENRADLFFDAVEQRINNSTAGSQPVVEIPGREVVRYVGLSLKVNDASVPLGLGASFSVEVPAKQADVVVTDAEGHSSRYVFNKARAAPGPDAVRLRFRMTVSRVVKLGRARRLPIRITCQQASVRCSGALTVTSGGRRLARANVLVPTGASARVRVPLRPAARSLVRRRVAVPVTVTARLRDAAGARRSATRRVALIR